MQNFEAADVARLDRAYSTPQIVEQRRRFRAAVAARPGETGLDVGCGAGHLACELAREVTPVPNVARALEEAARVLRKGGRLLVLESDWDMCLWKSKDPGFTRRMISARAEIQFAHAYLPRDLHRLFRAAGLTLADVQTFSIVETRYDPSSYGASVIGITRDSALKYGVSAEDAAAWEADLRSRTAEGDWFFCLDRFVFTGTK